MEKPTITKEWFEHRHLTLDLADLSDEDRKTGSIFLGGSASRFVKPADEFEYRDVGTIVFNWGDPQAEAIVAVMLEHYDNPDEQLFFPFNASTVIDNNLWTLEVHNKSFNPLTAYPDKRFYKEIPFDETGAAILKEHLSAYSVRPQLIGKVGQRWMLFEMGMDLDQQLDGGIDIHL